MQRRDLVTALNTRRDNDVYVRVPCETGGYIHLPVREVVYNGDDDTIDIVTDMWLDGPDSEGSEPPHPQHVTLVDDGSGDAPAVVHGDVPLSPEGAAAMRQLIAAAKRHHAEQTAADPARAQEMAARQQAAIARIRERKTRLLGGGAG